MDETHQLVSDRYLVQCRDGSHGSQDVDRYFHESTSPDNKSEEGTSAEAGPTREKRTRVESKVFRISKSSGTKVMDKDGVEYLDAVSGVCHVGHRHRAVAATVEAVLKYPQVVGENYRSIVLPFTFGPHDNGYVNRLLKTMDTETLDAAMIMNSGSEVNDIALQLARKFTGHFDAIVFEGAFHGSIGYISELSSLKADDETEEDVYNKCYDEAIRILEEKVRAGRKFACLFSEPVFTFHSMAVPNRSFFKKIASYVKDSLGALVVIDEVQTGMGRLGYPYMWGFKYLDIVPDVVTCGKPLGNGHPMSVIATNEMLLSCLYSDNYINQHAGNIVQAAVGQTVIEIMENDRLLENAAQMGTYLTREMSKLTKYPCVGVVRGMGLLLGLELVEDPISKKPNPDMAKKLLLRLWSKQVLVSVGGLHRNIISLFPPMTFDSMDAKQLVRALRESLEELCN